MNVYIQGIAVYLKGDKRRKITVSTKNPNIYGCIEKLNTLNGCALP